MDKNLERIMKAAASNYPVCIKNKVTKKEILIAITAGAKTLKDLKAKLPLCQNNECKEISVTGRGCKENAEALLQIYCETWKMMKH